MPPIPAASAACFDLTGRVESRRVLRPTAEGPRMEISFSGALASTRLGTGAGAFTFIAQPLDGDRYRCIGRGVLLLAPGNVSVRGEGWGHRAPGLLRYRGTLRLTPHAPALDELAGWPLTFEYEQDLRTLEVHLVAEDSRIPRSNRPI